MKICIFSDIHGNMKALNEMLETEKNVDFFIFAGDLFGYFYGQQQIIEQFMSMKNLIAVKGNHDGKYVIFLQESEAKQKDVVDRYGSSYHIPLPEEQRQYIEQLPEYKEVVLDGKRFGIYHGGMEDYLNQRIYPDTPMDMKGTDATYDFLILGHTHYQMQRKIGSMVIINPGSLGQPRDGKEGSYCILDTEQNSCEFKTVKARIKDLLFEVEKKDADKKVCSYLKQKYGGF